MRYSTTSKSAFRRDQAIGLIDPILTGNLSLRMDRMHVDRMDHHRLTESRQLPTGSQHRDAITSVIAATGACGSLQAVGPEHFLDRTFLSMDGNPLPAATADTIRKVGEISGIRQRLLAPANKVCSDLAAEAGKGALDQAGFDPEQLDLILVAHIFGDIGMDGTPTLTLPNLAATVKHKLGIRDPRCMAVDVIHGCAGWIEALTQADARIRSGQIKSALVIGADCISRAMDPCDRDSLLFADGAGACLLVASRSGHEGIVAQRSASWCGPELSYLSMSQGVLDQERWFMRMDGRKVFQHACNQVPLLVKEMLDEQELTPLDIRYFVFHQANEKILACMARHLRELYPGSHLPPEAIPMNISDHGNCSTATVPTLLHQLATGDLVEAPPKPGDLIVLASVGAGMHANAVLYRW